MPEGRVAPFRRVSAPGLGERLVEVWTPPRFDRSRRHAVLYMHDGQMLFDPTATWNRKAWQVGRTASRLVESGQLRDFIVVGIANDPARRHAEFFPQAALEFLAPPALRQRFIREALGGSPAADAYLRMIVEVVKPAVDAEFPTDPARDSTFVMGSSMGGLISLYGLCEYPAVFGGAAAMSTHWIGTYERNAEIPSALLEYLRRRLPAPESVAVYMDRGTRDLDALYDEAQVRVDALMAGRGFRPPRFESKVFEGAGHDESAWGSRLDQPLVFLLAR